MSVPSLALGPCSSWIGGDDVAACCDSASNAALYDDVALQASMLLFELSGRQYSGLCEGRKVRPCDPRCSCRWLGGLSWYWGDGLWLNDCGGSCGCCAVSQVKLAGYPVREIEEVKIDGAVIDASEYRLDRWRYLVRLDDPGPPLVKRRWPGCQNLALDDGQEGTFSVTYSWGVDPPPLAIPAAAELACQLYSACGGSDCDLPANATRIVRQGIEIDRDVLLSFFASGTPSGLVAVDAFLAGYGGPRRRPAVWSPDVASYPRPDTG